MDVFDSVKRRIFLPDFETYVVNQPSRPILCPK